MKIKNKKKIFILTVLFFGNFFVAETQAATLAEQCTFSGGTISSVSGKCTNCGCGKVTGPGQGAVCVTKEEYNTAVSYGDPSDAPDIQITECKPIATANEPKPRQFNYKLLEQFPGFYNKDQVLVDFPGLILSIYKFGIWTVGIAGLFMLVVGGFTYMTSAGNTSTAGSGRKIITDALLGIVAALGAYLILYVINPDLTKITIGDSFVSVNVNELQKAAANLGKCSAGTNECDVSKMSIFGALADQAAHVCQGESGGVVPDKNNSLDKCRDLNIFSVGLFQINLIANGGSFGLGCGNLFTINGPGTQGSCLKYLDNTNKVCIMRDCEVKASEKVRYDSCVQKLLNPGYNIQIAKQLKNQQGWNAWTAAKACGY